MTLSIGGPRESEAPGIYARARLLIAAMLDHSIEPHRRLLEPISHVPPAEAEAAYYAALEEPAALAA
jgi:hypothetical protein